ncbi:MAG: FAD-dependent monooxygenase [Streptosporangiaceae bacterium]
MSPEGRGGAREDAAASTGGSLNVGMLDAVNLVWKLAARVRGQAPAGLQAALSAWFGRP